MPDYIRKIFFFHVYYCASVDLQCIKLKAASHSLSCDPPSPTWRHFPEKNNSVIPSRSPRHYFSCVPINKYTVVEKRAGGWKNQLSAASRRNSKKKKKKKSRGYARVMVLTSLQSDPSLSAANQLSQYQDAGLPHRLTFSTLFWRRKKDCCYSRVIGFYWPL